MKEHENYASSFYVYRSNWNVNLESTFYVSVKQFSHHFMICRVLEKRCTNLHSEPRSLLEGKNLRYYDSMLGKCVGVS